MDGPSPLATLVYVVLSIGNIPRLFASLIRRYGPLCRLRLPGRSLLVAAGVSAARQVLGAGDDKFGKIKYTLELRALLGDGLVTLSGDTWRQHRRLIQPYFSRRSLGRLTGLMEEALPGLIDRFTASLPKEGSRVNIVPLLHKLTCDLACHTLFEEELGDTTEAIASGTKFLLGNAANGIFLGGWRALPQAFSGRSMGRHRAALNAAILALMARKRANCQKREDFISLLLRAQLEHPKLLPDTAVRDEILTMLMASHETTASTLTWLCVELAQQPTLQRRVAELAQSSGATGNMRDDQLRTTPLFDQVFCETLRLYPPAWLQVREALVPLTVEGQSLEPGDWVAMPIWHMQRDAAFWPEPTKFAPERFQFPSPAPSEGGAFFPFSFGPRACIGQAYAEIQARLLICALFSRVKFRLAQPPPKPQFQLLLRPPNTIWFEVESTPQGANHS